MLDRKRTNNGGRRLLAAAALAAVAAAVFAGLAIAGSAARTADATTCLNGFVWREATPADRVCVPPDVRKRTWDENAAAAARRNPNGGPYGPDTCLSPYVWREAVPGDRVCVDLRSRADAALDNQAGPSRRLELRTGISTYRPQTRRCSGDVCSITSDDAPRYLLRADRLNAGPARVILVDTATKRILKSWPVTVGRNAAAPGGYLSFATGVLQCAPRNSGLPNGYFRVQDGPSGVWSSQRYVWIGCKTL